VTDSAARALHDLLDAPGAPPGPGDELPLLWHWLAFLPQAQQGSLAPDGHPATGAFMPPMPGLRRMHAGGSVTVTGELRVEHPMSRRTVVERVETKEGRSGYLTFVRVATSISAGETAGDALTERADIVYLQAIPVALAAARAGGFRDDDRWQTGRDVAVDATLLFRFSALTYNAHRIHYDRAYAASEGYPGLVVHAPLQAVLLAHLAQTLQSHPQLRVFTYRAEAPAFDTAPLLLRARRHNDGATIELVAVSQGTVTMSAEAATHS
jgi:3-methylfumaryl-CoA hydratase